MILLFPSNESRLPVFGMSVFPNQTYSIFSERTVTTALPSPYSTKCRNYPAHGHSSRDECFTKCSKNESRATGSLLSGTIPVFPGEDFETQAFKAMSAHCEAKCSQMECVKESFKIKRGDRALNSKSLFDVALLYNDGTEFRVVFEPVMTFWTMVLYFMVMVGFWFGWTAFSLVGVAGKVADSIVICKHKRNQPAT